MRLMIPRAKGDQTGKGVSLGLPRGRSAATCPVRAMEIWLERSGCQYGPVSRGIDLRGVIRNRGLHPDAVRRILARRAALAGLKIPAGERLVRSSRRDRSTVRKVRSLLLSVPSTK